MSMQMTRRRLVMSAGGFMAGLVVSGVSAAGQSPLFITPTPGADSRDLTLPTMPAGSDTGTGVAGSYTSPIGGALIEWGADFAPVDTSFTPVPGEIDYLALDWDMMIGNISSGIRVVIDIMPATGDLDANAILAGFPPDLPQARWGYAPGTELLAGSAEGNAICLTFGAGPGTTVPGTMGVYSISLPANVGEPVIGAMIGMNWGLTASLENLQHVAANIQVNGQPILGPFPAELVWQSLATLGADLDAAG